MALMRLILVGAILALARAIQHVNDPEEASLNGQFNYSDCPCVNASLIVPQPETAIFGRAILTNSSNLAPTTGNDSSTIIYLHDEIDSPDLHSPTPEDHGSPLESLNFHEKRRWASDWDEEPLERDAAWISFLGAAVFAAAIIKGDPDTETRTKRQRTQSTPDFIPSSPDDNFDTWVDWDQCLGKTRGHAGTREISARYSICGNSCSREERYTWENSLVEQYLDTKGDLEILRKRLDDLIDEKESLTDARTYCRTFSAYHAAAETEFLQSVNDNITSLNFDIALKEEEVVQFESQCRAEDLIDGHGEPTDEWLQRQELKSVDSRPYSHTSSSSPRFPNHIPIIKIPKSSGEWHYSGFDARTKRDQINHWLLDKLLSSTAEARLLDNIIKSTIEGDLHPHPVHNLGSQVLNLWHNDGPSERHTHDIARSRIKKMC